MRKLERKYDRRLAVVGVHSPKFTTEQDTESLHAAIQRLNVGHPVINDRDFAVWQAYTVRAWPTLMFVDPRGKVIAKHEGEIPYEAADQLIAEMLAEFEADGLIDTRPIAGAYGDHSAEAEPTPLRFPGKVLADAVSGRLFISDSGHNRIVVSQLDGSVEQIVGSGQEGFADGSAASATFYQPQGLALDGETLYVADTENHAIRSIDLATWQVTTVAGTGEQRMRDSSGGPALSTPLSSPWDLVVLDGVLYIAMAGVHQIWSLHLGGSPGDGTVRPHTGNGQEALVDGPLAASSMNQPSGITTDGTYLYVADSEASAIRRIDPRPGGQITTIIGEGLFVFGDQDGVGAPNVRLQHPIGISWLDGTLLIADTYNHKIKRLDPLTAACQTWVGSGAVGHQDGPALEARLSEPCGLTAAAGRVFVADTNNHAIRVASRVDGGITTLELHGLY
ncbi:MAG: alkyl hydroperoxide reductase [Chloroflexota bacterium]